MSGRGEKRITIAVLDNEHRLVDLRRDVPESQVDENTVVVPADIIFPGQKRGKGLSNMAMTQLMRRLGRGDVTVHGFRSSFRDWAEERGGMPREIAELSLAHEVGNATERAYRRSDLLEKRRSLMDAWARFCLSGGAPSKVVELRA